MFNFKAAFGGGKHTGFACIYDSVAHAKKYHGIRAHLTRAELVEKIEKKGRKSVKESKNRGKKTFGIGRRIQRKKARRAGE